MGRRGAESRASIAGGRSETATASEVEDNNAIGEEVRVRGQRGSHGGSKRVRTHGGGPEYPGGVWRLGVIQKWSAPQWGDRLQHIVVDKVEGTGVHT